MVQRNIAPPSLPGLLSTVAEFDESVFERIAREISKPSSTNLSDDQFSDLHTDTQVDEADLRLFVSFLSFLYGQTEDVKADQLYDALLAFLTESVSEELHPQTERLANHISNLLQFRMEFNASEKRLRLTRGFLPFVISASSFVDLRTDFDRDENGNLTGKTNAPVTIVQLMLTTDSRKEQERQMILQLDIAAVKQLQVTLDEILHKIEILEGSK